MQEPDLFDQLMEGPPPIEYVPPLRIPWYRKLMGLLPGFCKYCGKKYMPCWIPVEDPEFEEISDGCCCPDGHESVMTYYHLNGDVVKVEHDVITKWDRVISYR